MVTSSDVYQVSLSHSSCHLSARLKSGEINPPCQIVIACCIVSESQVTPPTLPPRPRHLTNHGVHASVTGARERHRAYCPPRHRRYCAGKIAAARQKLCPERGAAERVGPASLNINRSEQQNAARVSKYCCWLCHSLVVPRQRYNGSCRRLQPAFAGLPLLTRHRSL
jgi:hypothetical protein